MEWYAEPGDSVRRAGVPGSPHRARAGPGCGRAGTPMAKSVFSGQRSAAPISMLGAAVGGRPLMRRIGGVDNVHTLGFGLGRTGAGLGRIPYVSAGVPVFARAGTRFESHLGHVFSLFRGLLASECAQTVHLWAPSGAIFVGGRCCGRRLLLVVSGSGGAAYSFMARGAASCMTGRWLGERCCRCWFAFLDGMTVHGDVAR